MLPETCIPKIIHQTWKTAQVPAKWQAWQASWQRFHPEWRYMLWTDADNRRFIEEHYPDFIATYDAYSYNIQRADAIRYFILHHFGGLYVDLDIECLRPVDDLVLDKPFIIAYEPRIHAEQLGEARMVGNAFMASIPGSLPLVRIIETLSTRNPRILDHSGVLQTTGPKMVNAALRGFDENAMRILDEYVFYPYPNDSPQIEILKNAGSNSQDLKKHCLERGAYAIHYWANSWVRNLAGPLINSNPHDVKGYRFYPGQDSQRFDIKNVGRDIQVLVAECNADPQAVGFNTDGYLKYGLVPRPCWVKIDNETGNQGLYIKNDWRVRADLMLGSLFCRLRRLLSRW